MSDHYDNPLEGVDYADEDWDLTDKWGRAWPWDADDLAHAPGAIGVPYEDRYPAYDAYRGR